MEPPELYDLATHVVTGGPSGPQHVLATGSVAPTAVVLHLHGGPQLSTTASQVTAWRARLPDTVALWCCDLVGSTVWGDDWAEALNADWMDTRWHGDIAALIAAARDSYPSVPVLLCGESWGGYVVLRAASAGMGDGWAALMPVCDWSEQLQHPRAAWDLALQALDLHDPADHRITSWNIQPFASDNPGLLVWAAHDDAVSPIASRRLAGRLQPRQPRMQCLELTQSTHREQSAGDLLRRNEALSAWVERCIAIAAVAGV